MRPILIPVAAKTDANGAASIDVRLERTGDWRAVKIALGTTGPAEWSAVQSGVPVTFGRGRRVTLGPELMQPDDTLKIEVTGGPVLAQITGSVSGIGGTMQEIIEAFKPEPNTIALDTSTSRQKLFPDGTTPATSLLTPSYTVNSGATVTNTFTLPAGTVELIFSANASGLVFTYQLLVVGRQSGTQYFGSDAAPGSTQDVSFPTRPLTVRVGTDLDTQVSVTTFNSGANQIKVDVSALFQFEAPGQAGDSTSVNVTQGRVMVQEYDWAVYAAFTAAGTPSISKAAAGGGNALIVAYVSWSIIVIGGGAATTPLIQLFDGGSVVDASYAQVANLGMAVSKITEYAQPIANAATLQWDRAIGANQFATLSMGGWIQ